MESDIYVGARSRDLPGGLGSGSAGLSFKLDFTCYCLLCVSFGEQCCFTLVVEVRGK